MNRTNIQQTIIVVIGIAGILAIAAIAPNVIQVIEKFSSQPKKRYFKSQIQSRIARLKEKGWIEFLKQNNHAVVRLTPRGKHELARYRLHEKTLEQRQWDGWWRVIIFDIREYKRTTRNRIRRDLVRFGFHPLQQSVWVYPHECHEIITLLKADHHIGKELLYITAKTIENDRWLKRAFGIPEFSN